MSGQQRGRRGVQQVGIGDRWSTGQVEFKREKRLGDVGRKPATTIGHKGDADKEHWPGEWTHMLKKDAMRGTVEYFGVTFLGRLE